MPAQVYFYSMRFCCACPRRVALDHFSTASVCFLSHCTTKLPPSTGLFFLILFRNTEQTTHSVGECTYIHILYTITCEQWAHEAGVAASVSVSAHSLFYFSDLPFHFLSPSEGTGGVKRDPAKFTQQSLKFPPADFLGQTGTRFNQSWDKSRLTTPLYPPLLHPATLSVPSLSYLSIVNVEQCRTGCRAVFRFYILL